MADTFDRIKRAEGCGSTLDFDVERQNDGWNKIVVKNHRKWFFLIEKTPSENKIPGYTWSICVSNGVAPQVYLGSESNWYIRIHIEESGRFYVWSTPHEKYHPEEKQYKEKVSCNSEWNSIEGRLYVSSVRCHHAHETGADAGKEFAGRYEIDKMNDLISPISPDKPDQPDYSGYVDRVSKAVVAVVSFFNPAASAGVSSSVSAVAKVGKQFLPEAKNEFQQLLDQTKSTLDNMHQNIIQKFEQMTTTLKLDQYQRLFQSRLSLLHTIQKQSFVGLHNEASVTNLKEVLPKLVDSIIGFDCNESLSYLFGEVKKHPISGTLAVKLLITELFLGLILFGDLCQAIKAINKEIVDTMETANKNKLVTFADRQTWIRHMYTVQKLVDDRLRIVSLAPDGLSSEPIFSQAGVLSHDEQLDSLLNQLIECRLKNVRPRLPPNSINIKENSIEVFKNHTTRYFCHYDHKSPWYKRFLSRSDGRYSSASWGDSCLDCKLEDYGSDDFKLDEKSTKPTNDMPGRNYTDKMKEFFPLFHNMTYDSHRYPYESAPESLSSVPFDHELQSYTLGLYQYLRDTWLQYPAISSLRNVIKDNFQLSIYSPQDPPELDANLEKLTHEQMQRVQYHVIPVETKEENFVFACEYYLRWRFICEADGSIPFRASKWSSPVKGETFGTPNNEQKTEYIVAYKLKPKYPEKFIDDLNCCDAIQVGIFKLVNSCPDGENLTEPNIKLNIGESMLLVFKMDKESMCTFMDSSKAPEIKTQ